MSLGAVKFLPDNIPFSKMDATVASAASVTTEAARAAAAEALLVPLASVGALSGVCPLDGSGLIPAAYWPAGIDKIEEYANFAAFPGTGLAGVIYLAIDTLAQYRWSGSVYVELTASPGTTDAVTEGSINLYFTTARVLATALTGFVSGAGVVSSADTVLSAINKIVGNIAANVTSISSEVTRATAAENTLTTSVNTINSTLASVGLPEEELLTLNSTDITNQYKDLAHIIVPKTLKLNIPGGGKQYNTIDFTLSTVSGKTRVTFINGLATGGQSALVSGDKLECNYQY